MICVDNHVDIKIITTGAQIAAYTLTDEKIYYNQKDNEITPSRGTPKTKISRHLKNDVSRQHNVRPERLELSRHKALEPKSSASANSATGAVRRNTTRTSGLTRKRTVSNGSATYK